MNNNYVIHQLFLMQRRAIMRKRMQKQLREAAEIMRQING